jgi:predicted MFS family arabinose efflux permease
MTAAAISWRTPMVVLIGGSLIAVLTFGIRADFGLLMAPISSTLGWGREIFGFSLALQNLIWGISQPLAGAVADKFGSGRVLAAGGVLYAAGVALMAVSSTPGMMHLTAGVVVGIALGCASFSVVLAAIGRVVPEEKRSIALGIGTAAGSFGQFVMVPLGQGFIDAYGWQTALLILAALAVLVVPLASTITGRGGDAIAGPEQTLRQAIRAASRHASYWYLLLGFFVCGFQIAFMSAHLPAYITDIGQPAKVGAWAISIVGLFNIFGAYFSGVLGGRYSKKYLLSGLYLARSAVVAVFLLLPPSTTSVLVFAAVMGILWLSTVPLTSGLVVQMFGLKYMATLFGFVFFSHQVGSFLGVWLGGYLYDTTGSYDVVWWGGAALGVGAAFLHWPIVEGPAPRLANQIA